MSKRTKQGKILEGDLVVTSIAKDPNAIHVGEVVRFGLFNYVLVGINRLSDGSSELSFRLAEDAEELAGQLGFRVQEKYSVNTKEADVMLKLG